MKILLNYDNIFGSGYFLESNGWLIIFLVFLILLSGFFSACETALMSLNKIKIKQLVENQVKGAKEIHRKS